MLCVLKTKWGLRIAQSPQEVMNRTRKEDELGVGRYHG